MKTPAAPSLADVLEAFAASIRTQERQRAEAARLRQQLVTPTEVASRLRVGLSTVYELAKAGKLASVRFGANVRFEEAEVERFLKAHREVTA